MRLLSIEVDTEQVTPQEAQEYIHKKKLKIKKVVNGMNKDSIMYIINDPIDEMGDVYEIPLKKGKITHYIQYDDKTGGNTLKKIWSGIKKADHYLSFIPSYAMGTTGIYAVADLIENNGNLDKTIDRTVNAYKTGYELTKKALGKGTEWTLDIDDDDDDIYGGYTQPQMKALQKVYYEQKDKTEKPLGWHETQGIFHKTKEGKNVFSDDYKYRGKMSQQEIKRLFKKYTRIIKDDEKEEMKEEIKDEVKEEVKEEIKEVIKYDPKEDQKIKNTLDAITRLLTSPSKRTINSIKKDLPHMDNNMIDKLISMKDNFDFFPTGDTIVQKIKKMVNGEHILEPCCGVGNIIYGLNTLKKETGNKNMKIVGNEMNEVLCDITKSLFPDIKVYNEDFLKTSIFNNNDFDCIVMNPPFTGQLYIHKEQRYKNIKNYYLLFVLKALAILNMSSYGHIKEMILICPEITDNKNIYGHIGFDAFNVFLYEYMKLEKVTRKQYDMLCNDKSDDDAEYVEFLQSLFDVYQKSNEGTYNDFGGTKFNATLYRFDIGYHMVNDDSLMKDYEKKKIKGKGEEGTFNGWTVSSV